MRDIHKQPHGAGENSQLNGIYGERLSVGRRDIVKGAALIAALGLASSERVQGAATTAESGKTRATYYTPDRVQNARENIEQYDWARAERDEAVAQADEFLDRLGLEGLWSWVTSQKLPRSWTPNEGKNIHYGAWQPVDGERFKVTDGNWTLPTNDFESYYQSGLDERGFFEPELGDDSLLVNEEHPEMGEGWGVDDGYGFVDDANDLGAGAGTQWKPVAFWNLETMWKQLRGVMLPAFRDAYLFTGDKRYSRAGTILLDRMADIYPTLDLSAYIWPDGFQASHGFTGEGKWAGSISEAAWADVYCQAYDAVFEGQPDDTELVQFLSAKADEYPGLGDKSTLGVIRENIEERLVKEVLPAVKDAQLRGNFGHHQSALAMSARVADEPDGYTKEALEFMFRAGDLHQEDDGTYWGDWYITGGDVMSALVGRFDRDGMADESSPHYNRVVFSNVLKAGQYLEGYDAYSGSNLFANPKFKQMFYPWGDLVILDNYTPSIGDHGLAGQNGTHLPRNNLIDGYSAYGGTELAQTAYYANGGTTAGIQGDIFDEDPALAEQIQAIIDAEGPLDFDSTNQPGYGLAVLRDGENYTSSDWGTTYGYHGLSVVEQTAETTWFSGSGTLQFNATEAGEHITFEFQVPAGDEYRLDCSLFKASSYGRYDIEVDGAVVHDDFDFYSAQTGTRDFDALSWVSLDAGTHTITFRNDGKNPESSNYKMGIRKLRLMTKTDVAAKRRSEEQGNLKRAVWLYYGRNSGETGTYHTHGDTLNLGIMAHELDLAPDLGYPHTFDDQIYNSWLRGTISHNTVMVDERRQRPEWAGEPHHFDHTDRVQLIDVSSDDAYPQVDAYRRTTAQIRVDEADSYAVDFFHVNGGTDHHFSFHSAKTPSPHLEFELQDGVSEFVVRDGAGEVKPTKRAAYSDETAITFADPSGDAHDWRGLAIDHGTSDVTVETYIKSAVTGENFYWHHNHSVYLGRDGDGRHVVAGIGNQAAGHDPRIGIYYPEENAWGDYTAIERWDKDAWYELSVSKTGTAVDIALTSADGSQTHASGTFELASDTDAAVGIFGGIGKGQTGNLYFDEVTVDGSVVEFFETTFVTNSGIDTTGLDLVEQDGGTYAGADVPFGDAAYNEANANAFNYLERVSRDENPEESIAVEWNVADHWNARDDDAEDVRLRLTAFTAFDDVSLADGRPPNRAGNPETLRYLLGHRTGTDLESTFTSVIEPYDGPRFVESVERVPVEVVPADDEDGERPEEFHGADASSAPDAVRAVKVTLANGRTDYIVRTDSADQLYTVDREFQVNGFFAVYSLVDGEAEYAYLNDGTVLRPIHAKEGANEDEVYEASKPLVQQSNGAFEGTLVDFTKSLGLENELVVKVSKQPSEYDLESLAEKWVYVDAETNRNGAYEVLGVTDISGNRVTLDIGEKTTVREFVDPQDPSAGYEYIVATGAAVTCPTSLTWRAD
ncbi:heparinase II/III family protein [Haladaptatus sp. DYSN1]|uniref:heparinase II/III domain-containing protein n=1 Tax=unclassified Haladaptatus TaxID=2622732 RepID=UPI002406893B|nr:heparinase II/III family protein [Haladaptatus sp. DYSN1]